MNRGKHPSQAKLARVSVPEIAIELGVPERRVRLLLRKHGWWLNDREQVTGKGKPNTYDALIIEKLRGLLGQPHRQVETPDDDWLARYLEQGT